VVKAYPVRDKREKIQDPCKKRAGKSESHLLRSLGSNRKGGEGDRPVDMLRLRGAPTFGTSFKKKNQEEKMYVPATKELGEGTNALLTCSPD